MREVKAKQIRKRSRKSAFKQQRLPFTRQNYLIFALGVVVILIGYFALAQPPADSFMSLTVAPILLVTGYCVIIPFAILYRPKKAADASTNGNVNGRK